MRQTGIGEQIRAGSVWHRFTDRGQKWPSTTMTDQDERQIGRNSRKRLDDSSNVLLPVGDSVIALPSCKVGVTVSTCRRRNTSATGS